MSTFANKLFNGRIYVFGHLASKTHAVDLHMPLPISIPVQVTYGCHCFTEAFDDAVHQDHHRYTHLQETRAFNVERYICSLQLPCIVTAIMSGRIYQGDRSYTYMSKIILPTASGQHSYSVFFSLEKSRKASAPAAQMYIKSAYLSGLKAPMNARSWRFPALVGEITGGFASVTKGKQ